MEASTGFPIKKKEIGQRGSSELRFLREGNSLRLDPGADGGTRRSRSQATESKQIFLTELERFVLGFCTSVDGAFAAQLLALQR